MNGVSNEIAHLPVWVRRWDGSQVPFEADFIGQSLYAAAASLGAASPFLSRELTEVVCHFLAREHWDAVPTTAEIAEQVEKIVREVGQPELARRYADSQRRSSDPPARSITIDCGAMPDQFVNHSLKAYALEAIHTPDVAAAVADGLLWLGGLESPGTLSSLVLETPRLAELPWWLALDDWRAAGGAWWIVDSPEWLCTAHMHPALTAHLCERLLALPTFAQRNVELHLNVANPPAWSPAHAARPLFTLDDEDVVQQERTSFRDSLLERWKALEAPRIPALAWHLGEQSFQEEPQRRQLHGLLRQALQGRAIRFIFDRPRAVPMLAEGVDRKCPGVLLEIGLDLAMLARRLEIGTDGVTLLKRLPSLARMAVSAAQQKYRFLCALPDDAPLKRSFLVDRASAVVVPIGLHEVVRAITGASLTRSPLALEFALQILRTLTDTLQTAGRAINLDLRLDSSASMASDALSGADVTNPPRKQLDIAGKLHACAGAGTTTLLIAEDAQQDLDALTECLAWAWSSTGVARLQLQAAGSTLHQGELPI